MQTATLRDNKSLRARCTMLLRALDGEVVGQQIVVVKGTAVLEPTLKVARLIELNGGIPQPRWARDLLGHIIGIELVMLRPTVSEEPHAPVDGMDVTDGDDEFVARLTAAL